MANINELLIGWGLGKQTDIATANLVANVWRMGNLNAKPWPQKPVTEDDSKEIGKSHEFATALFKSHYDPPIYQIQKYASSEMLGWMLCFGLGHPPVIASGQYTITPLMPATDGTELPYFSFIQQIRPGGSSVLDQMLVGCAVKAWKLAINSSPGRGSAMCTADCWTSGKYTEPSAITMPAATVPHEMNAGGLTCTINGVDYITPKSFISLDMGMDNVIRPGYFPGSGSQDGYQIQGRAEIGDRIPTFSFVARYANGSTELTLLRALTTGTAGIGLSYDSNNSLAATWQKIGFEMVELSDAAGIVTVMVTAIPMYHATNGLFSAVVKCPVTGIGQ